MPAASGARKHKGLQKEAAMRTDRQHTLEVLRNELHYIEQNGYQNAMGWRPQLIFEDSPTCPNFREFGKPHPCTDCALIEFVSPEHRHSTDACRYIPLDDAGQTLDSLYRWASESEIETLVMAWLRKTIARLEQEAAAAEAVGGHAELTFGAMPNDRL
jgi:hypothetical protein